MQGAVKVAAIPEQPSVEVLLIIIQNVVERQLDLLVDWLGDVPESSSSIPNRGRRSLRH